MNPEPLNLEDKNPYPTDIFTEITDEEWKNINKILEKELGFPLDRVAGNINRKLWNNMREWFKERVKSACDFYLRYKDNPELFVKEHPEYKEEEITVGIYSDIEPFPIKIKFLINSPFQPEYKEWLFKLAFKGVME